MSRAANSHDFKKLNKPSRCRECDTFLCFNVYECVKCGLSAHKKCLETIHLMCGQKRLPRKMTTFGVPLGDHLLQVGAEIPPLVCRCVAEIDKRGINIKGVYRVSGVKSRVEKLCQAFENGAELVDLSDVQPNVIANVVKLYMRQLPEPLCTFRSYSDFIREGRRCPALESSKAKPADWDRMEGEAADHIRKLCLQLPNYHLKTLGFLCHHLHRISKNSEINNMPASNLAIVFGPTLLRTSESPATLSSVVDTKEQVRVVELMTKYAYEIFGSEASQIPESRPKYRHKMSPRQDEVHDDNGDDYRADEELDNEAIPDFLKNVKKSPLLNRSGSPPQIQLVSLKNFSGLENVRAKTLSSQDSLRSSQQPSQDSLRSSSHLQPQDSLRSSSSSSNMQSQDSLRSYSHMNSQDSVRSGHNLAGQDSVDSVNHMLRALHIPSNTERITSGDHQPHHHHHNREVGGGGGHGGHGSTAAVGSTNSAGEQRQKIAIIEENKVKIQVPGPGNNRSTPVTTAGLQQLGRAQLFSGHKSEDH